MDLWKKGVGRLVNWINRSAMLLFALCGCRTVPFEPVEYVSLVSVEPTEMLEAFSASLAKDFEVLNTVVFEYRFHTFPTLGYTSVDNDDRAFAVACLNPMGVKILELSVRGDKVERRFVLEFLPHSEELAQAVEEDVRRIYFDRIPSPRAEVIKEDKQIVFIEIQGGDVIEYVFAGKEQALIEKKYFRKNRPVWAARYYEYRRQGGRLHPWGIVFTHYRHKYRLVIRCKEIYL